MSSATRTLSYRLAINEALHQAMAADRSVFLLGQGVKSPWYVGNTAKGLLRRFGMRRVIDSPVSENGVTGAAVGAALTGMRPVVVHPRMDFMLYCFDPIINQAANWYYMSGGTTSVPVVFWGIVNRGGEQAAQHSQALHSMFCHVPGLKVVAPSSPADAKGLMLAAIFDDDPVVFMDDRSLYGITEHVPVESYRTPIGKGAILRKGTDVTILCYSGMVPVALDAASLAERDGVSCSVVDLRTLKPFDKELTLSSVAATGRVIACDVGWTSGGWSAEILATIAEAGIPLKRPPRRVALPDAPAGAARTLEQGYYPTSETVLAAIRTMDPAWSRSRWT
ncbi:MAG: transketolase C-terminal domain-containing protein [Vicinamibacterales bacterium]|nr:transketolase C-terminal domain-containing protein [Vicinamibacterales bacterium]